MREFYYEPFSNSFEKKWTFIFLFMYVLIMLPFPWYYATEYIPSFWGTPLFIFGWIFHGLVVYYTHIFMVAKVVKNDQKYKEFDE